VEDVRQRPRSSPQDGDAGSLLGHTSNDSSVAQVLAGSLRGPGGKESASGLWQEALVYQVVIWRCGEELSVHTRE